MKRLSTRTCMVGLEVIMTCKCLSRCNSAHLEVRYQLGFARVAATLAAEQCIHLGGGKRTQHYGLPVSPRTGIEIPLPHTRDVRPVQRFRHFVQILKHCSRYMPRGKNGFLCRCERTYAAQSLRSTTLSHRRDHQSRA